MSLRARIDITNAALRDLLAGLHLALTTDESKAVERIVSDFDRSLAPYLRNAMMREAFATAVLNTIDRLPGAAPRRYTS